MGGGAGRREARGRRGDQGPRGHPASSAPRRPSRPTDPDPEQPDAWWIIQDDPALAATDIKNPEQNFDQRTNEPIVTMDFTDEGQRDFQARHARTLADRGSDNGIGPGRRAETSRSTSRSCSTTSSSRCPYIDYRENPDGIDGETGAQISGSLHDPVRAGPGELPQDRRAADPARADLALAGLGHARPAGARPGPQGGHRRLRHRRALPARLLPRARPHRGHRAGRLRALLLRDRQAHPDRPDAAGHRGPDPHARRRGGREHRHLRTRQGGDQTRQIDGRGDRRGLQEGHRDDHRRERRHVARRLHPLHPRDGGRQGLRASRSASARSSRCSPRCSPRRRSCCRCAARDLLKSKGALGAARRGQALPLRLHGRARGSSSRSRASSCSIGALGIAGKGLDLGIDFEAGTRIQASLGEPATVDEVRDTVEAAGFEDVEVQTVTRRELGDNVVQISTAQLEPPEVDQVEQALDDELRRSSRPRRTRSARPSASRSPTRRSSRSSPRCWSSRSTSRCASSGSSPCRC